MEVERYKMIFTTKINEESGDEIDFLEDMGQKIKDEIISDNIRILGNNFVKNNKNKAKLLINNRKYNLKELVNNKEFTDDKIKINMILSKDISNVSNMFKDCTKLFEISAYDDIININDEEFYKFEGFIVYNIDDNEDSYKDSYEDNFCDSFEYNHNNFYIFDNDNNYSICSEITKKEEREINLYNSTLNEIKNKIIIYQYSYYSNMSEMFSNCISLFSLSDIFKWNTNNVKDMSGMFYNCSSLLSLPDISKWNTINVTDISNMFYKCSSLSSIPDISQWNTSKVEDMSNLFYYCSSLSSLPDISKWNFINVRNMSGMFYECSSLRTLPDISK